jgi:hypothetical protein
MAWFYKKDFYYFTKEPVSKRSIFSRSRKEKILTAGAEIVQKWTFWNWLEIVGIVLLVHWCDKS